jgi:hypothetical protein
VMLPSSNTATNAGRNGRSGNGIEAFYRCFDVQRTGATRVSSRASAGNA